MEIWTRNNRKAAVFELPESEQNEFFKWGFQLYQESPLGPVPVGKIHKYSSKKTARDKAIRMGFSLSGRSALVEDIVTL